MTTGYSRRIAAFGRCWTELRRRLAETRPDDRTFGVSWGFIQEFNQKSRDAGIADPPLRFFTKGKVPALHVCVSGPTNHAAASAFILERLGTIAECPEGSGQLRSVNSTFMPVNELLSLLDPYIAKWQRWCDEVVRIESEKGPLVLGGEHDGAVHAILDDKGDVEFSGTLDRAEVVTILRNELARFIARIESCELDREQNFIVVSKGGRPIADVSTLWGNVATLALACVARCIPDIRDTGEDLPKAGDFSVITFPRSVLPLKGVLMQIAGTLPSPRKEGWIKSVPMSRVKTLRSRWTELALYCPGVDSHEFLPLPGVPAQEEKIEIRRQPMTTEVAQKSAEAIVKKQGWQKSRKQLAKRVGCSEHTLRKAIDESPMLRRAEAEYHSRKPRFGPDDGEAQSDELAILIAEQRADDDSNYVI